MSASTAAELRQEAERLMAKADRLDEAGRTGNAVQCIHEARRLIAAAERLEAAR